MGRGEVVNWNEMSRKDLLALPTRKWDADYVEYDSLVLLSTRKKHDSGYAMIAIIGCRKYEPVEIAVQCCDDVEWVLPEHKRLGQFAVGQVRMDCSMKNGAMHVWSNDAVAFRVGAALSSTTVTMRRVEP